MTRVENASLSRSRAREVVLSRVRAASPRDARHEHRSDPDGGRRYRVRGLRATSEVLDLFVESCEAYGASVVTVADEGVGNAIGEALARAGSRQVMVAADIPAAWRTAPLAWREDQGSGPLRPLTEADAVVTGCAVGVAETGTIILDGGRHQGRRALTLVPDHHLCVVEATQVVELLPEAFERLRPSAAEGRPITFVSGCSATSDIEMERVAGVHGPRNLDVVVVG